MKKANIIKCALCDRNFSTIQALSNHLGHTHKIDSNHKQDYYDQFMKQKNEGICLKCGKLTHFQGLNRGYTKYCCKSCQVRAQGNASNPIVRQKMQKTMLERYGVEEIFSKKDIIQKSHNKNVCHNRTNSLYNNLEQFEKDNNCTLANKIGRIPFDKIGITPLKYKNRLFIKNTEIKLYYKYQKESHRNRRSQQEKYIANNLKEYEVLCNDRKQIYPYEIDIYIPKFNLGIEFNGTWHHSIENNMPKAYHLQKSLRCRNKRIRLIHIYEFEDLDEQINKIKLLLRGIDTFNKNDFNKNNLIDKIPAPEIIYAKDYTVYGAGKLYK